MGRFVGHGLSSSGIIKDGGKAGDGARPTVSSTQIYSDFLVRVKNLWSGQLVLNVSMGESPGGAGPPHLLGSRLFNSFSTNVNVEYDL